MSKKQPWWWMRNPPSRTASSDMDEIAAAATEVRAREVDAYGLGENPPATMCLLDSETDYMESVEVGLYTYLPRHIRGEEWAGPRVSRYHAVADIVGRLAETDIPPAAMRRGEEMRGAIADTLLVGDTDVVDGWWIETHTLGCRNTAGDPEAEWLDRHWAIYDEYAVDPRSVVLGDPTDGGVFVTFTPQRGAVATRVEA